MRKYKADLEEQQVRIELLKEQTKESKKRQNLLNLKAELFRRKIALLDKNYQFDQNFDEDSMSD